jgi:hypothetical protein
MLTILRNALNPASYPTLENVDTKNVSQTSEPIDPRAPLVQPVAEPTPATPKE